MFDIFTTFDLSYLGDSWKDCYLKFHPITVEDLGLIGQLEQLSDDEKINKTIQVLQDKFVEGFAMENGQKIAVTKEHLKQFPMSVLLEIVENFTSGLSKKKLNPSGTSSEVTQ